MIVYLARDIPAFVMYCVDGESGSSLLIECTDSMILPFSSVQYFCGAIGLFIGNAAIYVRIYKG